MDISSRKDLSELNLIDSFLFNYVTRKNNDAEFISRLIIERATDHVVDELDIKEDEASRGLARDKTGMRLDIYAKDLRDGIAKMIYGIEPNNDRGKNLIKEGRYYQAISDSIRLCTFNRNNILKDFTLIWILPYDPFGKNRMIYSVKNTVIEDTSLTYDDGLLKLFLYTDGEIGGTKKLKELLTFFKNTCKANAVDEDLKMVLAMVNRVKQSEEAIEQFVRFKKECNKKTYHYF